MSNNNEIAHELQDPLFLNLFSEWVFRNLKGFLHQRYGIDCVDAFVARWRQWGLLNDARTMSDGIRFLMAHMYYTARRSRSFDPHLMLRTLKGKQVVKREAFEGTNMLQFCNHVAARPDREYIMKAWPSTTAFRNIRNGTNNHVPDFLVHSYVMERVFGTVRALVAVPGQTLHQGGGDRASDLVAVPDQMLHQGGGVGASDPTPGAGIEPPPPTVGQSQGSAGQWQSKRSPRQQDLGEDESPYSLALINQDHVPSPIQDKTEAAELDLTDRDLFSFSNPSYQEPTPGTNEEGVNLWVENPHCSTGVDTLRGAFGRFRTVSNVSLPSSREHATKRHRGVAGFNPTGNRDVQLRVGILSSYTSVVCVRHLFENYGKIIDLSWPTDLNTGQRGDYAFVTMPSEDAERACADLNGYEIDGHTLSVSE